MELSDFYIPCSFEERRPLLLNRFLYIPPHYYDHDSSILPPFTEREVFGNGYPVHIEYCSGNGEWILQKALQNPKINWIAVEMRFDRARKIWVKMHNHRVKNLFLVFGEALTFTSHYLKEKSIANVFVNFPDPWPKTRHKKNRLLKKDFFTKLSCVLKKRGKALIVTDDYIYCERIIETLYSHPLWKFSFEKPYYITEWQGYGGSYFDTLWREKGREIYYMEFEK